MTFLRNVSNTELRKALGKIANATRLHVTVHSGDRGHNPKGSNNRSEHRLDLGGGGAADFHLFREDGTRVSDAEAAGLILETGVPEGTRLLYHDEATITEGEHLHLDTRTDKCNCIESGGNYSFLTARSLEAYFDLKN